MATLFENTTATPNQVQFYRSQNVFLRITHQDDASGSTRVSNIIAPGGWEADTTTYLYIDDVLIDTLQSFRAQPEYSKTLTGSHIKITNTVQAAPTPSPTPSPSPTPNASQFGDVQYIIIGSEADRPAALLIQQQHGGEIVTNWGYNQPAHFDWGTHKFTLAGEIIVLGGQYVNPTFQWGIDVFAELKPVAESDITSQNIGGVWFVAGWTLEQTYSQIQAMLGLEYTPPSPSPTPTPSPSPSPGGLKTMELEIAASSDASADIAWLLPVVQGWYALNPMQNIEGHTYNYTSARTEGGKIQVVFEQRDTDVAQAAAWKWIIVGVAAVTIGLTLTFVIRDISVAASQAQVATALKDAGATPEQIAAALEGVPGGGGFDFFGGSLAGMGGMLLLLVAASFLKK